MRTLASQAIARLPNKKLKLIVCFRNPIDRAYSLYQHERRKGTAPATFNAAIESEMRAIVYCSSRVELEHHGHGGGSDELNAIFTCLDDAMERERQRTGVRPKRYIIEGLYVGPLLQWRQQFGSRLLVIFYEDIRHNIEKVVEKVVEHLELPSMLWTNETRAALRHEYQQGSRYRRLDSTDPIVAALQEVFTPYSKLLAVVLGITPPWLEHR